MTSAIEKKTLLLDRAVRDLLDDLRELGFGDNDDDTQVSGADTVDTINQHFATLDRLAAPADANLAVRSAAELVEQSHAAQVAVLVRALNAAAGLITPLVEHTKRQLGERSPVAFAQQDVLRQVNSAIVAATSSKLNIVVDATPLLNGFRSSAEQLMKLVDPTVCGDCGTKFEVDTHRREAYCPKCAPSRAAKVASSQRRQLQRRKSLRTLDAFGASVDVKRVAAGVYALTVSAKVGDVTSLVGFVKKRPNDWYAELAIKGNFANIMCSATMTETLDQLEQRSIWQQRDALSNRDSREQQRIYAEEMRKHLLSTLGLAKDCHINDSMLHMLTA